MKVQCIAMVTSPTLRGTNKLTVYGTLEIGEVPRLAAMENATPKAIIQSPVIKTIMRLMICSFLIFSKGVYHEGERLARKEMDLSNPS